MNAPYLSVIMGVYNCPDEKMLMRSISSVLEQSFTNLEFIICDDGSDNGTSQWLEAAALSDDRIILIKNDDNMSLANALNRCIELARGVFIARQDADDYSLPDRFIQQIEYLEGHPKYAFVGSDCLLFDESDTYGRRKMPHHPKKNDFLFNSPFVHGSVMFRRELFDKAGYYRPCGACRKYEDYDLFMRAYDLELNGANINTPLYAFHYDSSRRVSRKMRIDEAVVRYNGFRRLGLMPVGMIYVIKPVFLALVPNRMINFIKRSRSRRVR